MTPKTNISILTCSDDDIHVCFQVMSKSFGHDAPFIDMYFPNHDTPQGEEQGIRRLTEWKRESGDSTFLKAVAREGPEAQEQIIGFGVWTHMKVPPPQDLEEVDDVKEVWPDEEDREYMKVLWKEYVTPRSQVILEANGAGAYVLELLAIHPDWQRHGAGSALVMWGINNADEKGIEAVVEATPAGSHCYEKCGLLVEIEQMQFDVGERFGNRRKIPLRFQRKRVHH